MGRDKRVYEQPVPHGAVLPVIPEAVAAAEGGATFTQAPGDGDVTATTDGGGRVLKNARIVLIYWGSVWASPATSPSQATFTNAILGILSGPWGEKLSQYRGAGVDSSVEAVYTNTTSEPHTNFTNDEIKFMIEDRIENGKVPTPSNSVDRIYCVVLPTGKSSSDNPQYIGQHQCYTRLDLAPVYWAWITNDGTLTGFGSIPKIFTHEVAEACTDPGCTFNNTPLGDGITVTPINTTQVEEIGDVCNNSIGIVSGVAQQAYWSANDNLCVLPTFTPGSAFSPSEDWTRGPYFGNRGTFFADVTGDGRADAIVVNDNTIIVRRST